MHVTIIYLQDFGVGYVASQALAVPLRTKNMSKKRLVLNLISSVFILLVFS